MVQSWSQDGISEVNILETLAQEEEGWNGKQKDGASKERKLRSKNRNE